MKTPRPLSPHIQIYRFQLTSILSGLHRVTGLVLSAGSLVLLGWILALVNSENWYDAYQKFFNSYWGLIFLMGISFCYFYHLFNGMRHLVWDSGHGYALQHVYKSGCFVIILATLMTGILWFLIISRMI